MIGSIIGDIVGSVYEFTYQNIKTKDFPLFSEQGNYTDDSILTVATADWLLHGGNIAEYYSRYGAKYPRPMGGYGGNFQLWIARSSVRGDYSPYNSCGNGSAMRVGPVGWAFDTKDETLAAAKVSAECTHNHPEGIKGAQAIALCIFMARKGFDKDTIRKEVEEQFGYDLNFTCDGIRDSYTWGGTCQDSVPQAIVAFLDGNDFEDCIRNAISIGGDSDTIGCITGSIAEAFYGVPNVIRKKALEYLPEELKKVLVEFENIYKPLIMKENKEISPFEFQKNIIEDYENVRDAQLYFSTHGRTGTLEGRTTPKNIRELKENEVFVFGSNAQGYHGGGAAAFALNHFGAVWGQGDGIQGQSYAISTMEGLIRTARNINRFIKYAHDHPEKRFYVTAIGCGIAGYTPLQIAPLFERALVLPNVFLPEIFWEYYWITGEHQPEYFTRDADWKNWDKL